MEEKGSLIISAEVYNRSNSARVYTRDKSCLYAYPKSNRFDLNASAVRYLELGDNYGVEIIKDKNSGQWYIARSAKPEAFRVSIKSKGFSNSTLLKKMGIKENTRFLISTAVEQWGGYELHPLIPMKNQGSPADRW